MQNYEGKHNKQDSAYNLKAGGSVYIDKTDSINLNYNKSGLNFTHNGKKNNAMFHKSI